MDIEDGELPPSGDSDNGLEMDLSLDSDEEARIDRWQVELAQAKKAAEKQRMREKSRVSNQLDDHRVTASFSKETNGLNKSKSIIHRSCLQSPKSSKKLDTEETNSPFSCSHEQSLLKPDVREIPTASTAQNMRDNYEVVNMEIESPPRLNFIGSMYDHESAELPKFSRNDSSAKYQNTNNKEHEDEAEKLRQILLDQMNKKKRTTEISTAIFNAAKSIATTSSVLTESNNKKSLSQVSTNVAQQLAVPTCPSLTQSFVVPMTNSNPIIPPPPPAPVFVNNHSESNSSLGSTTSTNKITVDVTSGSLLSSQKTVKNNSESAITSINATALPHTIITSTPKNLLNLEGEHIESTNATEENAPRSPEANASNIADTMMIESSDTEASTSDLTKYQLNLDEAMDEDHTKKKEILRLFKRQKNNEAEYERIRKLIDRKKNELKDMERKLSYHAEKGMQINNRLKMLIERYFATQCKRLNIVKTEREKWKSKVTRRSKRSRQKLIKLQNAVRANFMPEPPIIPLNRATSPINSEDNEENRAEIQMITTLRTEEQTLARIAPSLNASPVDLTSEANAEEQKETQSRSRQDSSFILAYEGVPIGNLIANYGFNEEAERELYNRMAERVRQRKMEQQKPMEEEDKNRPTGNVEVTSASSTFKESKEVMNTKLKTDLQDKTNVYAPLTASTLSSDLTLLTKNSLQKSLKSSQCLKTPLEEVLYNPLLHVRAYRLSPAFPHQHIKHPAITNRVHKELPLCPYELHGICADPTCSMQHDCDLRSTEEEIIREILDLCPTLCPKNVDQAEYARFLLRKENVEMVARTLALTVSEHCRSQLISEEIQQI